MTRLDSWYHEKESAWLYQKVAAAEPDPRKRNLFLQLAAAAEEQAAKWVSRAEASRATPRRNPDATANTARPPPLQSRAFIPACAPASSRDS